MDVHYDDQTAFHAAANGDFPLVVLLWGMAMAVQPHPLDLLAAKDPHGNTLIHYAASSSDDTSDTMHFLIQQMEANQRQEDLMDAKNDAGETPLIRAAHAGNIRLAQTLLRSGYVDLLAQDTRGNTAAHHAAAQGQLWMLHFLLEAERRRNAALGTKNQQHVETTTRLGGFSFQHRNVLHYACMCGSKPMIQYLLTQGFDAQDADANGTTCLELAKQRHLPWLEDFLTGDAKVAEPPTHMRKTRPSVAICHGTLLLSILATNYWLVWWLALPLIMIVLFTSLLAFRQKSHGSGGHSHSGHHHGEAPQNFINMHPSKRNANVAMHVSLEQVEEGLNNTMASRGTKVLDKMSVRLHTLTRPQPESAMGIWMAWVGLFTLLYVVLCVDPTYKDVMNSHIVLLSVTGGMEILLLVVWARLAFIYPTDPGRISTYEHDVKLMLEKASRAESPDMAKFCRTCLVMKPIRSKHCAQCGICIARHDHHCAWINRCVGYGNHRLFFFFLILHCIVLVMYTVVAILVLSDATHNLHAERVESAGNGDSDSLSTMDIWVEIPSLVSKHLLVVMVLVWSVMAFMALEMMFTQQLRNIVKNLTINEQLNWRRYAYMTPKPASISNDSESSKQTASEAMFNPFDRGLKMNVLEFFFRSKGSAVDYYKLFTVVDRDFHYSRRVSISAEAMSGSSNEARDKNDFNDIV